MLAIENLEATGAVENYYPASQGFTEVEESNFRLPEDLLEWVSPNLVAAWVEYETTRFACFDTASASASRMKNLLSVLSFSYAVAIYPSARISEECRTNPILRNLCGGQTPFAHELWSTRRRCRRVLRGILTEVFARALRHKAASEFRLTESVQQGLESRVTERLDLARHMDTMDLE